MIREWSVVQRGIGAAFLLAAAAAANGQFCRVWSPESSFENPAARSGQAMAYDAANGYTLIWGGVGIGPLADTWSWNGEDWSLRASSGPAPRAGYVMGYDSARAKLVLTGNPQSAFLLDTWEWDGTQWNLNSSAAGPSARAEHGLAFDAGRSLLVLFGGQLASDEGFLLGSDTWEYNGGTWVERTPLTTTPAPRVRHAIAYDAARGVTVMFGGFTYEGELNDTWEWDGEDWTLAATSGPPATSFGQMVYDAAAARVLLVVGGPAVPAESRTWAWNGATWTLLNAPDPLGYRFAFGMAYDTARSATVLFGGQVSDGENTSPSADTFELRVCAAPTLRGDANCDGSVDFFDIDPFLLALFDPPTYTATFCGGALTTVDVDCSGGVDFFDIDPFLACLFATCPDCP